MKADRKIGELKREGRIYQLKYERVAQCTFWNVNVLPAAVTTDNVFWIGRCTTRKCQLHNYSSQLGR